MSTRKTASAAALRAIRPRLLERADGCCEITGAEFTCAPHAHHRLKRGGPERDVLSNLLAVSGEAHVSCFPGSIHAEPARSRELGWILSSGDDPTEHPVWYRSRWVLLADDGTVVDQ